MACMSLLPAVKVIAPKASRETGRPVEPRVVYCMRSARAAGSRPNVEIAFECVMIDPLQLLEAELHVTQCAQAFLDLLPAAGTDQRAGDGRLAQHPGDCHLRQALPTLARTLIERTHVGEIALLAQLANLPVAIICGLVHREPRSNFRV